jgi:OmcA/MtrC family decaheme c-type cytochrome
MPKEAIVKYFELSSKSRPSSHWIKFAAASLIAVAIAGCGGGGTGANTTVASNPAAVAKMAASSWQALKPQIDPASISVSIPADGKPVVTFKVTDELGNPVVGLGGQIAGTATALPTNYNLQFTLAKLIPATLDAAGLQTKPSKWVSYLVTKPGTIAAGAVTSWAGTFPTSDTNGTLVDNNDGSYKYTFLRNITAVQAQVNALTDVSTATVTSLKSDLDPANLAYDATATTRLGILIVGSQPGTGTNTPTKIQSVNPIPLVNTFNIGFDFVPNGSAVVNTRDIVTKDSCSECHDARGIGHISVKGTSSLTASPVTTVNGPQYGVPNGIPAGSYVGRNDPRLCVTCHTDQTKYSFPEATQTKDANGYPVFSGNYARINGQAAFTFPRMVHQFHMGSKLVGTGYNLNAHCNPTAGTGLAECFNNTGWPQSPADCTKCHDGNATKSDGTVNTKKTKDGNVWKNSPSVVSCGACHDGIDFAKGTGFTVADKRLGKTTPTGHAGGTLQGDVDATCASCHAASGSLTASKGAEIVLVHNTNTSTLNNPGSQPGVFNMSYNIKSVTVNTSGQPVITFQILKDNVAVTALAVPTVVTNGANGQKVVNGSFEPIPGLVSGPTFYVAYAVPQDGIAAPADFNASASVSLANLLVDSGSPKAGSITGPDASGYFTATLTGDTLGQAVGTGCAKPTAPAVATCVNTAVLASPIKIPATAKLVTGAMIGTFTQTNLAAYAYTVADITKNPAVGAKGGLVRNAVLKTMVATGFAPRRAITAVAKCAACHEQLGTDPSFHGGARNDPTACNICHNANKTSSGWTANSSTFVHGIHAKSKRTVPFMWTAVSATDNYSNIGYPGLLKDCNQCHLPNTVNFGATGGTDLTPTLLWPTNAAGTISATSSTWRNSPYITAGTVNYGNFFTYTAEGATVSAYTPSTGTAVAAHVAGAGGEAVAADGATLVSSPISSACFSCHDSAAATTHITGNGGKLYAARASVTVAGKLVNGEDCLTCHGAGRVADVAIIHK